MSSMSRRAFLKSSAALATASAVARAAASPNERIRVGIIGCRSRGWQNGQSFAASDRFDVTALCDCDTAMLDIAMAKLEGKLTAAPKLERDFRRLLDDKSIDAICVATPDYWHAVMALMALDAGKHVYLEKPATYCIDEGKALVAAQKKHPNLAVLVGTQHRSGPHFHDAKEFLASGVAGRIGFVRAWTLHDRGTLPVVEDSEPPATLDYDMWLGPAPMRPYNKSRGHYNWHFMWDTGTGDMGNWGAHWLDSTRHLLDLDLPTKVSGMGDTHVINDAKEFPDTQTVLYEYHDLTVLWELRLWAHYGVNGKGTGVEFHGDAGTVIVDRGGWAYHPRKGEPKIHKANGMQAQHMQNFADVIAGAAKPAASIEDGHKSAMLCHLGNIATKLKRTLKVNVAAQTIEDDPEAAALMTRKQYRAPWVLPA